MTKDKIEWVPLLISAADLNISKPPTLYLMAGEKLAWEHLYGPLRIRMHHGSVIEHCRFGAAVQIDVPKKPKKGVPHPHLDTCSFGGNDVGFKPPKPLR